MTVRLYAVYSEPEQLLLAIESLRARGYRDLEAYTPYPVEGLADALGLAPSPIPRYAFLVGLTAAAVTYFIQWLINAYLYPINVGSRPPHFPLSFVPVCFEVGVLFAAFTAVFYVTKAGRFGALWDPVFELPNFTSVTRDRHWLEVRLAANDDVEQGKQALRDTHCEELVAPAEDPCA